MVVQEPVQAAIWHSLNYYKYSDAIFLAERLYAEVGTDDALFLLSTCYFRAGKTIRAYTLLKSKGCATPQCKYLLAQCCISIKKLTEAESVLAGNILLKNKAYEDIVNEHGEAASYTLALLAHIYSKTERLSKAVDYYKKSLKLNPFLWSSYEALCQLGEKVDPTKIFQVSLTPAINTNHPSYPTIQQTNATPVANQNTDQGTPMTVDNQESTAPLSIHTPQILFSHVQTPENTVPTDTLFSPDPHDENSGFNIPPAPKTTRVLRNRPRAGRSLLNQPASFSPLTPSFGVLPLDTPSPGDPPHNLGSMSPFITPSPAQALVESTQPGDPKAPKKPMTRRSQQLQGGPPKPPVFSQSGITNTRDVQTPSPQTTLQNSSYNVPNVRRSSRLFSNANSNSVKENNKSQSRGKFPNTKAPAKKSKSRTSKSQQELNEINKSERSPDEKSSTITAHAMMVSLQKQSAEGLLNLLTEFGKAYQALCQYECKKAIQLFTDLQPQHYNTGWVLSNIGRAYFEMAEYKKAEKIFNDVRRLEPHHLEGMEFLSTTYWHLQKEVQLSALAQELTELDRDAPEAWCATGNCFSIQKEHDTAIKFFQRAIQVDPNFAYAYTLLGHEYVSTEEYDKAMTCFRNSIRVDQRHYNAWYGIGMIYYKQEKFSLAEVHFRKALSINPQSSVLLCHIGVVQHALQKTDSALVTLNKAVAADPKNPLCKFHRASILFSNDKHTEALAELEELKQIIPKESLVYFFIGKVQKKLGNTHLALMNLSWATDLDPKSANTNSTIQQAVDKRYVTDDEDQSLIDANNLEDGDNTLSESQDGGMLIPIEEDIQLRAAIESDESL
ncbi:unnamed protein product [Owenia fusiformis]|uniref:Cell division cycle protein 27 homolog n=1 Tax=Owenia fusiformis TaxID=6347 RepID=A0A8J1Y3A5_OWEFU|nr:unnamed protein product [Owenia fusiformis]